MSYAKAAVAALVVTFLVSSSASSREAISANQLDPACPDFEIQKPGFFARHWTWSGIFPLYGGFIEDPHVKCFPIMRAPEAVAALFDAPTARVQLAYLNPFWNDETSQILVLVATQDEVLRFSLTTPQARTIVAWSDDSRSSKIRSTTNGSELIVFVNTLEVQGVAEIPVGQSTRQARFAEAGTTEFDSILTSLASSSEVSQIARDICLPATGKFVSLAFVWFRGCTDVGAQAEFGSVGKDLVTMYNALWQRSQQDAPLPNKAMKTDVE